MAALRPLLFLLFCSLLTRSPSLPVVSATSDEPCPQCAVRDRGQAARLKVEAIKQQILSKLHLQGKPNITAPLPRELALEALRRTQGKLPAEFEPTEGRGRRPGAGDPEAEARDEEYYARTSEIIAFAEPGRSVNGHVLLDFFPSQEHAQLRVTAATLWIQLRYVPSLPKKMRHMLRDRPLTLYVFRVLPNATLDGDPSSNWDLLTFYRANAPQPGWRRLEVGQAVEQWFTTASRSGEKLTLLVDCVGCDSILEMVLFHDNGDNETITSPPVPHRRFRHGGHEQQLLGLRPFLAIATETLEKEPRGRGRRHANICDARVSRCCRQNLYVSFRELGWDDWIIAPKGYYANFCMGDCASPRTPDTFATFHTHVIEEYRNRNPYASIQPCCAPTRLSPMSLIYFDPDLNIIKTDLPKMIVEDCGCT